MFLKWSITLLGIEARAGTCIDSSVKFYKNNGYSAAKIPSYLINKYINYPQNEQYPNNNVYYISISQNTLMFIVGLIGLILFCNILLLSYTNCKKKNNKNGYKTVKYINTDSEFPDSDVKVWNV